MNKTYDIIIPDKRRYYEGNLNKYLNPLFHINETIGDIYKSGKTINGDKLTSAINPFEGMFMYEIIKANKFNQCMEVGMANGLSTLYICQALKELNTDGFCISIDPYQDIQWKNAAKLHIEKAGLNKYSHHISGKSLIAMPKILEDVLNGNIKPFDFILIDGWHTFDYTLVDFFYADQLLRIGGVIMLDDMQHPGVKQCVEYITKNYTHFKLYTGPNASKTMGMFIKIGTDKRDWNFHKNF